jgi:hypothetical protein|tara:strand:+ start:492 stop:911 length:420 start_codon:yes stop_codon:yes gene_type:complete
MVDHEINLEDLANKLFCTFTTKEELDSTLETIREQYTILFNKIFVLFVESTNEYVCTYNVDSFNMSNTILDNTILLHRKKDSNTLYTINALNDLIKELNEGVLDTSFKVNWQDYRNCILLTTGGELKRLDTKVHNIITF